MASHVALLRAVNVGGVKVSMADLRELAEHQGFEDVATYLNSGNLLLNAGQEGAPAVQRALEAALQQRYQRESQVMVRTPAELRRALDRQPFEDDDPTHLQIGFCSAAPAAGGRERLGDIAPEECVVDGREVFVHYPNGVGRSKLTNTVLERRLGVRVTLRGVKTVGALLDRC